MGIKSGDKVKIKKGTLVLHRGQFKAAARDYVVTVSHTLPVVS